MWFCGNSLKVSDCRRLFLAQRTAAAILPDALRIGNCIDLNDLAISDGEAHNGKGLPTYGDHDPGCPFTSAGCSLAAGSAPPMKACWATAAGP